MPGEESAPGQRPAVAAPLWTDDSGTLHEKCKIHFLVNGALVGETDFDPGDSPETNYRRCGVAYVCSHCGEVWAHALVLDSLGHQMPFDIARVACENHPDQWEIPGSLLSGSDNAGYLKLLSPVALKREFIVHHNHHRRKL